MNISHLGPLPGPEFLPENLLMHGRLSPSAAPARKLVAAQAHHGLLLPSGHIHLIWCRVRYGPPWSASPWNLCSGAWTTSSLSFFTDFASAGLFIFPPVLSQLLCSKFYPFNVCYHRHAANVTNQPSFGKWQVHLGACWN